MSEHPGSPESQLQKGQEALRAEEDPWQRTFDSIPDLIAIIDKEHRILKITGIVIRETGIPGKGARFEIRVPESMYRFNTD